MGYGWVFWVGAAIGTTVRGGGLRCLYVLPASTAYAPGPVANCLNSFPTASSGGIVLLAGMNLFLKACTNWPIYSLMYSTEEQQASLIAFSSPWFRRVLGLCGELILLA